MMTMTNKPILPLTGADRLPKQGDILVRGHERTGLALNDVWYRVSHDTGYVVGCTLTLTREWVLREVRPRGKTFAGWWTEWEWSITQFRYIERADSGRTDWPISRSRESIDCGEFV